MSSSTIKALEKVWIAEVEMRLPFTSRAAIYKRLAEQGLVLPYERSFGNPPFVVKVSGWQLSHAGRLLYCASC